MTQADPRFRNVVFEGKSVAEHFKLYTEALTSALNSVNPESLEKAFQYLREAVKAGRRIYVAGNGGSAAISDHLCCDWMKGTRTNRGKSLRAHSLVGNVALLTAFGNDYGYENCFSEQLEILGDQGDVLVVVSSSGNSPNIVKAAQMAQKKGMVCISFTGFSGGEVRKNSDVNLFVKFSNYGIVEDAHQAIMHSLSQYLAFLVDKNVE